MNRHLIFVSTPQKEFAKVRKDLCYAILTDPYFKEYFDVFLFENLPAHRQNPEGIYLDKVTASSIYLGIFGRTYGSCGEDGISATEKEFAYATGLTKDRIIFVKQLRRGETRDPKMEALIGKASTAVSYKEFRTTAELQRDVMRSLLLWQQERR